MRIVITLTVGIFLIGTILTVWWITQPMVWKFADGGEQFLIRTGANTTGGHINTTILKFAANIWGPLSVIGVMLWMVLMAQYEDWRGQ